MKFQEICKDYQLHEKWSKFWTPKRQNSQRFCNFVHKFSQKFSENGRITICSVKPCSASHHFYHRPSSSDTLKRFLFGLNIENSAGRVTSDPPPVRIRKFLRTCAKGLKFSIWLNPHSLMFTTCWLRFWSTNTHLGQTELRNWAKY